MSNHMRDTWSSWIFGFFAVLLIGMFMSFKTAIDDLRKATHRNVADAILKGFMWACWPEWYERNKWACYQELSQRAAREDRQS